MQLIFEIIGFFFIPALHAQPTFVVEPQHTAGLIGSGNDAYMNCSIDSTGPFAMAWEDLSADGDNQIYNSMGNEIRGDYVGRYEIQGQYNLVLKNISQRHGHAHKCSLIIGGPLGSTKEFIALGESLVLRYTYIQFEHKHTLTQSIYI